ncbi:hypothetical protein FGW37_01205 [Streptomyces rectiverticillatus]|uniref:hypothetical protein n=1 Tax=Streptomyces rectiverticillatus TaxID=173860 RepID=UPI0015C4023C|nr:hypothetical protein [Streptomyces rectiverticillatus]QLE70408.1 hypothetical protein FGW37_01205 [Streptomyces rectiverticillatus]
MSSRVTRIAIAAGAGLLVLAAGSTTAQARTESVSGGRTCLVNVDTNSTRCFGTFREAVTASTDGRITDAPLSGKDAARDRKLVDRLRVSSAERGGLNAELAILYEHWNFGGTSIILNGGACQSGNGRDYAGEFTEWADRISSVIPVACWVELWADPHQTGTHQEYRDSTPYVGDAMNDQASSYALL